MEQLGEIGQRAKAKAEFYQPSLKLRRGKEG